jgi:peptide/nickel transport system ATP-binding protein
LRQISGSTPSLLRLPRGCSFKNRCPRAAEACEAMPALEDIGGRLVRCYFPLHYFAEAA